jgi:DegV family protein with EDD domain
MIKVVTDSTSDLTKEKTKELGVKVVPLYLRTGDKIYRDKVDLSEDEFYKMLAEGSLFETSQPSPQDFVSTYKPIIENGDEIVSIHISSKLSGTVNSANLAKEILKTNKISVIDSKSTAADLGYKVEKVVNLLSKGASRTEIEQYIEGYYHRVFGFFLPMDINYLNRGGRIGHFQKTISNILKLYFILHLNEGRIDLFKIGRSKNGSKKELIEIVKKISAKKGGIERSDTIYGVKTEENEEFRKTVEQELGIPIGTSRIGPVLGSHLGPEAFGIAFITKEV